MRRVLILLLMLTATTAGADWRKTADTDEKVETLVDILPGTSHWMLDVAERYRNLYWAAKLEQWQFAAYQADKLHGLLDETVPLARDKRAETAARFVDRVYPELTEAVESRDWDRFEAAFESMRGECIACHAANDYGFIIPAKVPRRGESPALHFDDTP
ncbi:hypothetical protein [Spectribacter hydrogenoxidans]|uniref:Cytochrome c domain-containing protein n=1 Tax=Spectribacter hydrogenoxidans TaxID=3075608 RepID=A0ABU3C369_9GAMM|nr:hypothetical protein [Salinisphaera sp. W335]MDT0635990.1 hypothetical protein [Salinisphaera sp. W335]